MPIHTFGDKRRLFEESLRRYLGISGAMVEALLVPERGLDGVHAYLNATVTGMATTPRRACLMFNTCVELGSHDQPISKQLRAGVKRLRQGFEACLKQAHADGDLRADADVAALALFLTTHIGGMAVLSKSGASKKEMQAASDEAFKRFG